MLRFYFSIIQSLFFTMVLVSSVQGQQLAFPTAEGFGRFTTGGRGGEVYEVTNLEDSGPGSLREGIGMNVPRTIVFRVSGTIHLLSELKIQSGNLTIAGQTAPGDGIALKGFGVVLDADNVIIRYIRFRPGDISGGEPDAIWGRNHKDIIIDHCSMSWAVDEVSSFYDNENFTMQWCLLSESLYESQHEKGRHGYGGIWGGQGATFHHNVLAHHSSRNPRFNGSRYSNEPDLEIVDFRNNVIFNWGSNSAYGGEGGNHNMVANYYKPGPATSGEKRYRILDAYPLNDQLGKWYVENNYVEGYPDISSDNWNGGVQRLTEAQIEDARVYEPFAFGEVQTQAAEEAYISALDNSGATLPRRDAVDTRIMNEVESGTVNFGGAYGSLKGIIDTQEQVGGWPQLFSAIAPQDSDHDGIPNQWETDHGLDPENYEDGKLIYEDGYSNLERYLNALEGVEQPEFLKHPTDLSAGEISTSTIQLSWIDHTSEAASTIVERSADNQSFSVIAEVASGTNSFQDEGLEPGSVYYYRMKSVTESEESAYSKAESFTTLSDPVNPNPDELLGYCPFDAASGVLVEDNSSYQNHGAIVNSDNHTWVAGKVNKALDFSEAVTSAHITIPHEDHLGLDNQSFSVALWMNATATMEQAYLFHKGTFIADVNTGATGKWFGLEIKNDLIRFAVDDDVVKSEVSHDNTEFLTGEWVHIVAVRDRSLKKLKIYRNGILVQESADDTNGGIGSEDPLIVANSSDLNVPFMGGIDELKVYGYSLNASEIEGLYVTLTAKASEPSPADQAVDVNPESIVLNWSGNASSYNLHLGTSETNLSLEAADITESTYTLSDLAAGSTYYWRIDSKAADGSVISGDIWSFITESVTKIDEVEFKNHFSFYPNPVIEDLNVVFKLDKVGHVKLSVYNAHNQLKSTLINTTLEQGHHNFQTGISDIQMNHLANGVYYLVLETQENKIIKRILLLRSY